MQLVTEFSYPKPPIQEAILDVFTTLPEGVGLEAMDQFGEVVAKRFPDKKPRHSLQGMFQFNVEDSTKDTAASVAKHSGYIFRTTTKEKAVQARVDGFTFNRMPIYEGWAQFSKEARELWNIYRAIVQPVTVTKIALRYLNRLELPIQLKSFHDYCRLFPAGDAMPAPISGFMINYTAPAQHAKGAVTNVTVALQRPAPNKAVLPLIIDISVGLDWNRPVDSEEFWTMFEELRIEKNALFERSITDNSRNLFR